MRGVGVLVLLCATRVCGHPICFFDDRPTDADEVLDFCPAAQDGACCNDLEEEIVIARFDAVGALTGDCADLYKQVSVTHCCFVLVLVTTLVLLLLPNRSLLRSCSMYLHICARGSPLIAPLTPHDSVVVRNNAPKRPNRFVNSHTTAVLVLLRNHTTSSQAGRQ